MLEKTINELEINEVIDSLEELLKYEKSIINKKEKGLKLTKQEWFFDTYIVKPSSIISLLNRKIGEKNNVI